MIWHVFGYGTLAAEFVASGLVARWLYVAGTTTTSWLRRVPVPMQVAVPTSIPAGSDGFSEFVGHI
jgi:membrane protein implicated in regulation of membrane protease activity